MAVSGDAPWAEYQELVQLARRFVQTEDEARDLTQDALMIALDRGFNDWSSPTCRPWLYGVLRNRAALAVRGDRRRREREQAAPILSASAREFWRWQPRFLASLPPSLRAVAILASADLCAAEIRWLLGLSCTALRSRFAALRRAIAAEAEPPTLPAVPSRPFLGSRRALVLAGLKRLQGRTMATHDPDGHMILFRVLPHKNGLPGNT